MTEVSYRIAPESDDSRSSCSDLTNSADARSVGDPKEAAATGLDMADRSMGSGRSVIISVESWGAPNRLVEVTPGDSVDRFECELREKAAR